MRHGPKFTSSQNGSAGKEEKKKDHEKKQRRIDRLAEDWEEVGGSFNDSFQSWTLPGSGSAEGEERQYESGGESDVPKPKLLK